MALIRKVLYQGAVSASLGSRYTPDIGKSAHITDILIMNTTTGNAGLQLCVDTDGTTYNAANAIYWNRVVTASRELVLQFDYEGGIPLSAAGSLGARSSASGAITITLLGRETLV